MLEKTAVFFRCDAGSGYGFGHLMRCISLAQAFRKTGIGKTVFLVRELAIRDLYGKLLLKNDLDCIFLPEESRGLQIEFEKYAEPDDFNILVFDNYDVTTPQMMAHHNKFGNLVAIDDMADRRFCADFIVNQNLNAESLPYSTSGSERLLLGPAYALLRKSVLQVSEERASRKNHRPHIFMSFGGGDILGRISNFLAMFHALDRVLDAGICVDFAVSGDMRQAEEIRKLLAGLKKIDVNLIMGEYELAPKMKSADFAVTAAGTSVFELAFLGVPQLAVMIDKNQEITGHKINENGFGICLGFVESISEEGFLREFLSMLRDRSRREKMILKGRSCIDGRGAERVVHEVMGHYKLDRQNV